MKILFKALMISSSIALLATMASYAAECPSSDLNSGLFDKKSLPEAVISDPATAGAPKADAALTTPVKAPATNEESKGE